MEVKERKIKIPTEEERRIELLEVEKEELRGKLETVSEVLDFVIMNGGI